MFRSILMAAAVAAVAATAQAQDARPSIAGLHIGDPASAFAALGPEAYKPDDLAGRFLSHKWILQDGTSISVTVENATSKIAFLEADAAPTSAGDAADFPGFRYGVTTLSDIRTRLGSNGMGFKNRPVVQKAGEGVVTFNAYQFGDTTVTFVTLVSGDDAPKVLAKTLTLGDAAKLDAIMLASPGYMEAMDWGAPVKDPAYRPPVWQ
jgi:hypothetical protein